MMYKLTNGNLSLLFNLIQSLISKNALYINEREEWDIATSKIGITPETATLSSLTLSTFPHNLEKIIKVASISHGPFTEDFLSYIINKNVSSEIVKIINSGIFVPYPEGYYFSSEIIKEAIYDSLLIKEKRKLHYKAYKYYLEKQNLGMAGIHAYYCNMKKTAFNLLKKRIFSNLMENNNTRFLSPYLLLSSPKKRLKEISIPAVILISFTGQHGEGTKIIEHLSLPTSYKNILKSILFIKRENIFKVKELLSNSIKYVKDPIFKIIGEDILAYALSLERRKESLIIANKVFKEIKKIQIEPFLLFSLYLPKTYWEMGQRDKSVEVYEFIRDIAEQIGNTIKLKTTEFSIIIANSDKIKIDRLIKEYKKYMRFFKQNGMKLRLLDAYANLGLYLYKKGEFKKSEKYLKRAIEIAEELGKNYSEIISMNNLALLYIDTGRNEEAKELLKKIIKKGTKLGEKQIVEKAYGNIGVIYHTEEKYEEAYHYYEKALEISYQSDFSESRFLWIINLALLGVDTGKFENVEYYLNIAREEIKKNNLHHRWIDIEQIAGNCFFLQGKYNECLSTLKKVIKEAQKRGEMDVYYESLSYYAGCLYATGKKRKAIKLFQEIERFAKKNNNIYLLNTILNTIKKHINYK